MKILDTAEHPARQSCGQVFEASYCEAWGVWIRVLQHDHLKAVFRRREDAQSFADKGNSHERGQVRRMWVLVNETLGEAYSLGVSENAHLQAVDLDFKMSTRQSALRRSALSKLSEEEARALGIK